MKENISKPPTYNLDILREIQLYDERNKNFIMQSLTKIVQDALGDIPTRFLDASRIPILCKSIMDFNERLKIAMIDVHERLDKIEALITEMSKTHDSIHTTFVKKEGEYFIVRTLVFSGVSLVLVGVATVILNLVLVKP